MRDVFYTILVVWIVWRIASKYSLYTSKEQGRTTDSFRNKSTEEGKTTIKYTPPKNNRVRDDEGEYVDFEEIK